MRIDDSDRRMHRQPRLRRAASNISCFTTHDRQATSSCAFSSRVEGESGASPRPRQLACRILAFRPSENDVPPKRDLIPRLHYRSPRRHLLRMLLHVPRQPRMIRIDDLADSVAKASHTPAGARASGKPPLPFGAVCSRVGSTRARRLPTSSPMPCGNCEGSPRAGLQLAHILTHRPPRPGGCVRVKICGTPKSSRRMSTFSPAQATLMQTKKIATSASARRSCLGWQRRIKVMLEPVRVTRHQFTHAVVIRRLHDQTCVMKLVHAPYDFRIRVARQIRPLLPRERYDQPRVIVLGSGGW